MKKQLLICLLTLYTLSSFGQDKTALTKEETVNYLKKKLNEGVALKDKDNYYIEDYTLTLTDCYINANYSYVTDLGGRPSGGGSYTYKKYEYNYNFNPMQIMEIGINDSTSNANVGLAYIKLGAKTGKRVIETGKYEKKKNPYYQGSPYQDANGKWWEEYYYKYEEVESSIVLVDVIYIPYLKSDPLNFNKIKKALEHLRDLCKAEDDPFGE